VLLLPPAPAVILLLSVPVDLVVSDFPIAQIAMVRYLIYNIYRCQTYNLRSAVSSSAFMLATTTANRSLVRQSVEVKSLCHQD